MESIVELNLLHDFYGSLLTGKTADVVRLSLEENFSLSEIAERLGISRQGVHDHLKRGIQQLRHYESKLGLLEKHLARKKLYHQLKQCKSLTDDGRVLLDALCGLDGIQ